MRSGASGKTFSVFDVRLDVKGRYLPIVMFDIEGDDPRALPELTSFTYTMLRQGMSLPKLRSIANTIGLLHDFLSLHEGGQTVSAESLPSLILRFFVARTGGTIEEDGSDPSGLFWSPIKYEAYKADRRNPRLFSEYCIREYGFIALTPNAFVLGLVELQSAVQRLRTEFSRSKQDFFVHLRDYRRNRGTYGPNLGGRSKPQRLGSADNRSFIPYEELRRLILGTKSIVQRMIFVAGAFGSPRISEQLNMWRADALPGELRPLLFPDDQPSNIPLVILAHPFAGRYLGSLSIEGTTRAQHLAERYGRHPRPDMEKSSRAGCKGMLFDNEQFQISQIFWISPSWARYYQELVNDLRETVLPTVPAAVRASHPYLLINENPRSAFFGMPMKRSNVAKAWERACLRNSCRRSSGMPCC